MMEILSVDDVREAIREALPRVASEYKLEPADIEPVLALTAAMVSAAKSVGHGGDPWDGARRAKASAALIIACFSAAEESMRKSRDGG